MSDSFTDNSTAELDQLRFALQSAQIGTWTLDIHQQRVWWDARCKELYGFRQDDVVPYDQVLSYVHNLDRQPVDQAVRWALDPRSGGHYDVQFRTVGADDGQLRWLHCRGRADFDASGVAYRFAGTAQDITQQVADRQHAVASETRFQTLIQEAPVATSLFVGRELRVTVANAPMLAIWGKGPDQIGKTLAQILPEIDNQPFLAILDEVYTSGQTYSAKGGRADLVYDGVLGTYYFDFTYKPLFDEEDQVYAILQMAVDVTAQVVASRNLEESNYSLQSAIEVGELGQFSVNIVTGQLTCSARVADWFGFVSQTADTEQFINGVGEAERDYVRQHLLDTIQQGQAGRYDVTHSVVNAQTGQRRIIHALGKVYFDAHQLPLKVEGIAQDITPQHELQMLLEQQVQQRTEELAASNEELVAINEEITSNNEEYAAINEELEESNSLLMRSNDNLQTFAYIASHDLQEPLRKIQQFGDLLQVRFADSIDEEGMSYLERMQGAASRMSLLIRDLLSFSRISTQRSVDESVDLNQVVGEAVEVMDLAISEAGAQIQVAPLPSVSGDGSQLGQLFQNLFSNALKFRRVGVTPQIVISSQPIALDQLPDTIKPTRRSSSYHCIQVADNGIGFEEKYLNRIFGVFQRLHGKSQYAGTGVGLAICEKVVTNHGGVITARAQPDQGATFIIYLPADG